jgi:hypothetical protein
MTFASPADDVSEFLAMEAEELLLHRRLTASF